MGVILFRLSDLCMETKIIILFGTQIEIYMVFCFAGIPRSDLLHTRSVRGHKDCFEKYHKIANQDCSRSKLTKSPYEEVKTILSKKINWIVQYAQNKDLYVDPECSKPTQQKLYKFRQLNERSLLPQYDSQVPRYSEKWLDTGARSLSSCRQGVLDQSNTLPNPRTAFCHGQLWPSTSQSQSSENSALENRPAAQRRHQYYSKEQCKSYISLLTMLVNNTLVYARYNSKLVEQLVFKLSNWLHSVCKPVHAHSDCLVSVLCCPDHALPDRK